MQRCRRQKIKVFENAVCINSEIIFFWVGYVLERCALFLFLFFLKKENGDFRLFAFFFLKRSREVLSFRVLLVLSRHLQHCHYGLRKSVNSYLLIAKFLQFPLYIVYLRCLLCLLPSILKLRYYSFL